LLEGKGETKQAVIRRGLQREIAGIVGRAHVSSSAEDRTCYGYDATNRLVPPNLVAFPDNAEEIAAILRLANRRNVPVVPRGAGTGFTGGSLAVRGGILLSLERMDRILEIDEADLVAVVQPGVVTGEFQRAVAERGLFYPPDPASNDYCTLGGNVAENAGGMRAFKYGVTREYVLGLRVVLPDGSLVRTGGRTVKNVVGYDLTRLLVGSEGTLGIVTEITLKLLPMPEARRTVQIFFRTVEEATRGVGNILKARVLPSAMEFVDRASLDCVAETQEVDFPPETQAMLLVEVDGPAAAMHELCAAVEAACAPLDPIAVHSSATPQEADALWALRRAISPSLARIRPHRLNEDIVIPRRRLPEAVGRIREISRAHRVRMTAFGHAGDGNLHVNVLYDRDDRAESARAAAAVEAVMHLAVELGGSLSGEHGIGITKTEFIDLEVAPKALEVMRGIKALLDPKNILNPGKIFPIDARSSLAAAKGGVHHG
jgi:glycolate oxidase